MIVLKSPRKISVYLRSEPFCSVCYRALAMVRLCHRIARIAMLHDKLNFLFCFCVCLKICSTAVVLLVCVVLLSVKIVAMPLFLWGLN